MAEKLKTSFNPALATAFMTPPAKEEEKKEIEPRPARPASVPVSDIPVINTDRRRSAKDTSKEKVDRRYTAQFKQSVWNSLKAFADRNNMSVSQAIELCLLTDTHI